MKDEFSNGIAEIFKRRMEEATEEERADCLRMATISEEAGHITKSDLEALKKVNEKHATKEQPEREETDRANWEEDLKNLVNEAQSIEAKIKDLKAQLSGYREQLKAVNNNVLELIARGSEGYFSNRLF